MILIVQGRKPYVPLSHELLTDLAGLDKDLKAVIEEEPVEDTNDPVRRFVIHFEEL